jgi:LEA14-like dessication related protein
VSQPAAAVGWACALAAVAVLGLGGCRTVEGLTTRPEVRSVSVAVVGFDPGAIRLRFDAELLNPGDGEMRVTGYDYVLQIEERPFVTGTSQEGFALEPRGTARVAVPVSIALADLRRVAATLERRGEASYRLAVTLRIDTPLGVVRFPLAKDGCLKAFPPAVRPCAERS